MNSRAIATLTPTRRRSDGRVVPPQRPYRESINLPAAAVLILAASCAGLLASLAPIAATIGICAGGVVMLALVVIRRAAAHARTPQAKIAATQGATPHPTHVADAVNTDTVELRVARGFFYTGMLTLGAPAFRLASGLTVSETVFIFALAFCALAVIRGYRVPAMPTAMVVAVGVFLFGASISSLGAASPPKSAFQVLHSGYVLLLWPWVGAMVIRTRRQLVTALGLWAASGAFDGLGAIGQLAGLHGFGIKPENGRMTGFTLHANDLGGVAAVALVPALAFATHNARSALVTCSKALLVALTAIALVLSGSISGMAGAVLALLVWLTSPAVRSSSRIVVVAVTPCALGAIVLAGGRATSPLQRLTQVTSPAAQGANGSAQDRISDAAAAWQRIKADPFVGKGLDTPDIAVEIISHGQSIPYQVHGLPIAAWYETGIIGLFGLLGFLGSIAATGWQGMRMSHGPPEQLIAWGLLAAFAAFLVEVMTQPMVWQQYDWIIAVMLVAWSRRRDSTMEPRSRPVAYERFRGLRHTPRIGTR